MPIFLFLVPFAASFVAGSTTLTIGRENSSPNAGRATVLAVPHAKLADAQQMLREQGESCWQIGQVLPLQEENAFLVVR